MALSTGADAYKFTDPPVVARGASFTDAELDEALTGPVADIVWDTPGHAELQEVWDGLASTEFEAERIREVLEQRPHVEEWRIGEAFAEAYLVEHRACEFPWPSGRDLRNSSASPAGTDLVGFQHVDSGPRLAFGEVKTSWEAQWPPSVVTGRHGLQRQLEDLRDRPATKNQVVKYLGFHSKGAFWRDTFRAASKRYFADATDVSLFGVLVRDVEPKKQDLAARSGALAKGCPPATSIELHAVYLPAGSISGLAERAERIRHKGRP